MKRKRAADDLSEVVRQRLEALLVDVPPRRAAGEPPAGADAPDDYLAPQPTKPAPSRPRAGSPADSYSPADPDDDADPAGSPPAERSWRLGELGPRARQFVREHLVVVGIIVLAGCLWGGHSLLQARTTPVAVAADQPSVQVSAPKPASQAPSAVPTILVHVLGEVRRPGVVKLPQTARVQDALKAAGGLTGRARVGDLNLAAPVSDGAQIVIGRRTSQVRGADGAGGGTAGPGAKVDLNTATLEQLDALPGVGPVTAQKILAWRSANGRFRAVTELQEIDGIGPKTYAELAKHVRV